MALIPNIRDTALNPSQSSAKNKVCVKFVEFAKKEREVPVEFKGFATC